MKKTLITISLLIVATPLYIYRANISDLLKSGNTGTYSTVEKTSSDKFLDINRSYKDLTAYEKSIVDAFLKSNPDMDSSLKESSKAYNGTKDYKDFVQLKYLANDAALFFVNFGRGGYAAVTYKINKSETKVYSGVLLEDVYEKSDKYVVILDENNQEIQYLKLGDIDFKNIPNSKLPKGETYVKQGGMANYYELSISGNILKISVFKDEQHVDTPNTKLREVTFVLP